MCDLSTLLNHSPHLVYFMLEVALLCFFFLDLGKLKI